MKLIETVFAGALLSAGLGLAAVPASAQDIRIGSGGVQVGPGFRGDRGGDLIRIPRREGLVDVDDVGRRGPRLIVRGSDRRDDDITVVVDSRSGEVIDVRH